MRCLITGGAGFIGSHLAEALLEQGNHVIIIDDLSTGLFENIAHLTHLPEFHFAIDTITNELVLDRLVSRCDIIFHLAASVGVELIVNDPVQVIENNILGTHGVLKAAKRYRKKVLIASTSEIYGKNTDSPFHEESDRILGSTTKSRWSYSSSKAVDEYLGLAYYRQNELPVVIFRLFNTVGPRQTGQYGMVVPRLIQQALKGEPITVYGDGRQTRCFCNVEDSVRAIIGLAEFQRAVGQVFNIGSSEEVTILDLARKILSKVDSSLNSTARNRPPVKDQEKRIIFIPYDQAYEEGFEDMQQRKPDISKIRKLIGWKPGINLDVTLQQIINSMRPEA